MWRNTDACYGLAAILLHWLTALAVAGLFGLGLWMVDLTYYDAWYRTAPWVHKSVGVLVFAMLAMRISWRILNPPPLPLPTLSRIERKLSAAVHALLYLLLLGVTVSGYLISTADGQPVSVFGLVSLPATLAHLPGQAEAAGDIHLILAVTLVGFACLHGLAALKHHFVDRDGTLLRMLGRTKG